MKKIMSILLMVTMGLSMMACSSGASNQASTTTSSNGDKKYAMLLKPVSNEYWMTVQKGVEDWAEKNNVKVDVYAADSEENISGQLSQMEDLITKGYNGIAIAPLTSVNLIPGIIKANKAGIPVVNVDEGVDLDQLKADGGTMHSFVTTDNKIVGKKAAEFITKKIGTGEVAIIEGTSGNVTSASRVAGATDYFKGVQGISVVASQPGNWDRIKSLDVATNIMQSNPNLKAFYCANDLMALGVLQAVQNAGKQDQIIVVGTDATAGAKDSMKAKQLAASVGQANVQIAVKCIENLIDANKNGYKAEEGADVPVEYVDSFLVTQDNVDDYK